MFISCYILPSATQNERTRSSLSSIFRKPQSAFGRRSRTRRSGIRSSSGMRSKTQPGFSLKNPQTCRCASPRRQLQQRHIAQRIPLRVQAQGSAVPQGAQGSLTPRKGSWGLEKGRQGALRHPKRAAPACRVAACTTQRAPRRVRARHIPWHKEPFGSRPAGGQENWIELG